MVTIYGSFRVNRAANGWMLEPYNRDQLIKDDEIYVFSTMKELCEFLLAMNLDGKTVEYTK